MTKLNSIITGIEAYVPDYILNNEELSTMVDTSDEWIMQRIGIKERRILKEEGKATSDMGARAVDKLLKKTNTDPKDVDLVLAATITPDMPFPAISNLISSKTGMVNAWGYDLSAACSGFLYMLVTADSFIKSGNYKKIVIVGADMMSSITNYSDRTTCPLFGDGAAAMLVEPTEENLGVIDHIHGVDGSGVQHLRRPAGGSLNPLTAESLQNNEHCVYQEGRSVFKVAVSKMADVSVEIMERNNLTYEDIEWLVPHQANMRIIEAVAKRMGISKDQVMINIEKYGNTTAATIPLCLWEWEKKLKKGDNLILAAFGGGFTWGSVYYKWGYDS